MLNDPLAATLSNIMNAEKVGKEFCLTSPSSKVIKKVLDILKKNHYIGDFEEIEDNKGGILKIHLIGKVNKIKVIKPRFSVTKDNYEKFEKRFLPAKNFGFLIVSTSKGMMTHTEADEKGYGGKLIAFVY